jgi:hypothetical protein
VDTEAYLYVSFIALLTEMRALKIITRNKGVADESTFGAIGAVEEADQVAGDTARSNHHFGTIGPWRQDHDTVFYHISEPIHFSGNLFGLWLLGPMKQDGVRQR